MTAPHANFRLILLLAPAMLLVSGCRPGDYRIRADRETYGVLESQAKYPAWAPPPRPVEAAPISRNFDPAPPDFPPLPPDDPAAHESMHAPADQPGYKHWGDQGGAPGIEYPGWFEMLELSEDGELELTSDKALQLGLVHSREYQFEVESLYLAALALTLERFEFDVQWFGGNLTDFFHFGTDGPPTELNTLTTSSFLGFRRAFASGGQLLVDFTNTFVWEFSGPNSNFASSNLAINFVQPLLRGAFRDIRLESLTQTQRNVLYAARNFARFRKQFYFDIVSGNQGYLSLLLQLQNIRNQEQNLVALRQNLLAHEALAEAGIVSPLQVDQVFQSYQSGQLALIRATNRLETSLDRYKIQLGLPPELPVVLDDSQLEPFELTSAEVNRLDDATSEMLSEFRLLEQLPTVEDLQQQYARLSKHLEGMEEQSKKVVEELRQWEARPETVLEGLEEAGERERAARRTLKLRLSELQGDLAKTQNQLQRSRTELEVPAEPADAEQFERLARQASNHIADLFVIQTQIRTYLIQLPEIDVPQLRAVQVALDQRMDLMNRRAVVVDAWRKIRVARDALTADLDVFVDADIATDPDGDNPLDFSNKASSYRVGVQFDGPLNRMAERSIYRNELINYQRARRDFIARRDSIVQNVRLDLRTLEAERLNFEINRQSLVVAARQVELARLQLLAPDQEGDSSTTQDALNALNSLLSAKNALIATWVAYETARLQLLLDTEALQLDEQGQVRDDVNPLDIPTELFGPERSDEQRADGQLEPIRIQPRAIPGGERLPPPVGLQP